MTDVRVEVDEDSPLDAALPTLAATRLGRALIESGQFFAATADVPRGEVALPVIVSLRVIARVEDASTEGTVHAAVEASIRNLDEPPVVVESTNIAAERALDGGDLRGDLSIVASAHVVRIVDEVGLAFIARQTLVRGGDALVLSSLAADSPETVLYALMEVRRRRLGAALDDVIAILASEDRDTRETALGALLAIGDPRAVGPIAKNADFGDLDFMRLAIDAVASLGGDEASEYLEFVASGHPDPELQTLAEDGLRRLRQRSRHTLAERDRR